MNELSAERLHKLLAGFVHDEGLSPAEIRIKFTATKALVKLDFVVAPPVEDRKLVD